MPEQKETTLAEALRKAANFIRAFEICAKSTDAPKKTKTMVYRNVSEGERRPRFDVVDPHFTMDPQSILIEVKEHPVSKRPQPMTSARKVNNAGTYCEFTSETGIQLPNAKS